MEQKPVEDVFEDRPHDVAKQEGGHRVGQRSEGDPTGRQRVERRGGVDQERRERVRAERELDQRADEKIRRNREPYNRYDVPSRAGEYLCSILANEPGGGRMERTYLEIPRPKETRRLRDMTRLVHLL